MRAHQGDKMTQDDGMEWTLQGSALGAFKMPDILCIVPHCNYYWAVSWVLCPDWVFLWAVLSADCLPLLHFLSCTAAHCSHCSLSHWSSLHCSAFLSPLIYIHCILFSWIAGCTQHMQSPEERHFIIMRYVHNQLAAHFVTHTDNDWQQTRKYFTWLLIEPNIVQVDIRSICYHCLYCAFLYSIMLPLYAVG